MATHDTSSPSHHSNTPAEHRIQPLPLGPQLGARINALRNAYHLPPSYNDSNAQRPKRRGRPPKVYPLSDQYFAAAISALYRQQHPDDLQQKGTLSADHFRNLRLGIRGQPAIEKLQAIAEFFGVDVGYLVPTLAPSSPPGMTTAALRTEEAIAVPPVVPTLPSSLPLSAGLQSLGSDLAARRERVIVLLNELPPALDQLSPDQLTQFEHQVEQAIQIARRALSEFSPAAPDAEAHHSPLSTPVFSAPSSALATAHGLTSSSPLSPQELPAPLQAGTTATSERTGK